MTTAIRLSERELSSESATSRNLKLNIGSIAKLVNGKAFTPSDWSDSGAPIIRIQNLNDQSKPYNYWPGSLEGRVIVKNGDVLLAWSGTPGTSFGAHVWQGELGVLNQHIFRVDLDTSRISPDWFVFAVNHALDALISKAHGGVGLRHVTKGEVEKLGLPAIELATQKRIAAELMAVLAAVHTARRAARERLAAVKALPAAYMHQLFEVDSESTQEYATLGTVCRIDALLVDPKLPEYRDLPHVNGENIESGTGRLSAVQSAAADGMESSKYFYDPGVILYSKLRPYLRKVTRADFRGLCSADMYPLRCDEQRIYPDYLLFLLLSKEFTEYAVEASARARMPKLNREQLFAFEFDLPDLVVQQRIAADLSEKLAATQKLMTRLREELAAIESLPAALLRRAFNHN